MTVIEEGSLKFNFPSSFDVVKFDETDYYYKHFKKIQNNIKAIDILAIENGRNYMIEIKDYRYPVVKILPSELIKIIVGKFIGTLSAIYPMSLNAGIQKEKEIAGKFLKNKNLTIVLHLEKPTAKSKKLAQTCYNRKNIKKDLKRKLKPITNKVRVFSMDKGGSGWSVTSRGNGAKRNHLPTGQSA
jgi:hypothetical protein